MLICNTVLASKGCLMAIVQKVSGVGERDRDGDQLGFNGGDKIATVSNEPQQDDMAFEDLSNKVVDMAVVCRSSYWAKLYTIFHITSLFPALPGIIVFSQSLLI